MRYECAYCKDPVHRSPSKVGDKVFCCSDHEEKYRGENNRTKSENLTAIIKYLHGGGATRTELHEELHINRNNLYGYLRELRDRGKVELIDPYNAAVYRLEG